MIYVKEKKCREARKRLEVGWWEKNKSSKSFGQEVDRQHNTYIL